MIPDLTMVNGLWSGGGQMMKSWRHDIGLTGMYLNEGDLCGTNIKIIKKDLHLEKKGLTCHVLNLKMIVF